MARRTGNRSATPEFDVFLGDTMGELPLFYAAADVAFVGGSLVHAGGHNMLEPAALGVPIVFGPHVFNFAEISQLLLTAGGALQVSNATELADTVARLLRDDLLRRDVGAKARRVVEDNRGALDRLIGWIEQALAGPA
jgi:3-deoxy-D-manno-octulosonic-acid transferase